MIFGHLGLALLLKSKFYKRSAIFLIICCFLPDIIYYTLFGINYVVVMDYPLINGGLLRWLISWSGAEFTFLDNPIPLSHSIALWLIGISIFITLFALKNRIVPALMYSGAILSHLLLDFLLPDAHVGFPLVYPWYPFDPALNHFLPYFFLDRSLFWLIDLLVLIAGFFAILWAFSKNEAQLEYED